MKRTILSLALVLATILTFAQKKTTTSAIVNFDAATSIDALPKAENKTVIAALDTKSGGIAFEVNIKNFAFTNPRIQEHFNNAGWMDSDKYPTATFKGNITNLSAVKFYKDGTYPAEVSGDLTIHGVSQAVKTTGTIVVKGTAITANADFSVKLADYNISGAAIGAGKVSKEPKISVSAVF
ncbi:MAG TPA: YceI family protein [Ferruginibacter sp.]|nr:YceI family protein [Ferruginibacter sp.]